MKKILLLASMATASVLFTACATAASTVTGFIYNGSSYPVAVGSATGSKEGRATCTSILGWVAYGDCTINAAANNGGINQVKSVDTQVKSILGIYATSTTIVRGN